MTVKFLINFVKWLVNCLKNYKNSSTLKKLKNFKMNYLKTKEKEKNAFEKYKYI